MFAMRLKYSLRFALKDTVVKPYFPESILIITYNEVPSPYSYSYYRTVLNSKDIFFNTYLYPNKA